MSTSLFSSLPIKVVIFDCNGTLADSSDFMKRLAKEKENLGLKLGIVSKVSKSETSSNLRNLGIEDLFDLILSDHDDLKNYTNPEGIDKSISYLNAMKTLGIFPAQCVVIVDSATRVNAGTFAGCFTIAVPNINTRDQDFSDAHLRLESLGDISVDHFFYMIGSKNNDINSSIANVIKGSAKHSGDVQKRYIITGGPGSGKTSIINELAKRGYLIVQEAATDVIEEGLKKNEQAPWMADDYHVQISTLMAKRQEEVQNLGQTVAFFDRGHLDGITYILLQRRYLPQEVIDYVQAAVDESYFDKTVFFIENLEFCELAPHRDESLGEALEKSRHLKQNYQALGYEVVNIPPGTVEQRTEWIIEQIQQNSI